MLDLEGTGPESVIGQGNEKDQGKEKDQGTVPGIGTDQGTKIGLFNELIPGNQIFIRF